MANELKKICLGSKALFFISSHGTHLETYSYYENVPMVPNATILQLYDGQVWQFQLYATKCNYMQLCWYYIATILQLMQLYSQILVSGQMQLYATISHLMQLYATYATICNYIATYATILQLYSQILVSGQMQLYCILCNYIASYATICNYIATYATILQFMQLYCNYMQLYCNKFVCNYMQL